MRGRIFHIGIMFGFLLCFVGHIEASGWERQTLQELRELEREGQEEEELVSLSTLLCVAIVDCFCGNSSEDEFPRQYHGNMCGPDLVDQLQITEEDYYKQPKED